jgi:tRNA 2-thiouridine synthesizing protein A
MTDRRAELDGPPFADRHLDAGQSACGELLVLLHIQMRILKEEQVLHVIGYDRGAIQDIPAWCRMTGHKLLSMVDERPAHFLIQKRRR